MRVLAWGEARRERNDEDQSQPSAKCALNGRFTSGSKFTATATAKAPAEGVESNSHCTVPAAKLKFQLEFAA
jgi:hypothetical protein